MLNDPVEIQNKSFNIISSFLNNTKLSVSQKKIAQRVIHASADFRYAKDLQFSADAIKEGIKAIKEGKDIIVDSNMVKAGINIMILSNFGGRVICRIKDRDVIEQSRCLRLTCAMLAMRKSAKSLNGAIIAIGNSPSALFEICDLVLRQRVRPALIIGVPVGFVGAKEAKKQLRSLNIQYITNKSRRGGSSIAAAIVNALLILTQNKAKR